MADPLLIDFARRYPAEVAVLLAQHGSDEVLATLREQPTDVILRLLPVLPGSLLQRVGERAGDALLAEWLDASSFDEAVAVLVRLRAERRTAIVERLSAHRRRVELTHRFAWPEGVLGALAARNFVTVPVGASLQDVVDELLAHGDGGLDEGGDEARIYVLDDDGGLRGEVDVRRALEAEDREVPVLRCLTRCESLPADMPDDVALEAPIWRRSTVVPVLDRDQRPIGTVTLAAIRDAARGVDEGAQAFDTLADLANRFLEVLGGLAGLAFGGAPDAPGRRARPRPDGADA
ncbi:MAG TPA: CBS domain-containing protein [Pseudomonadales bacterium]|nr:CBS domain-containing protein [Pseudomonadales bacterium]